MAQNILPGQHKYRYGFFSSQLPTPTFKRAQIHDAIKFKTTKSIQEKGMPITVDVPFLVKE